MRIRINLAQVEIGYPVFRKLAAWAPRVGFASSYYSIWTIKGAGSDGIAEKGGFFTAQQAC